MYGSVIYRHTSTSGVFKETIMFTSTYTLSNVTIDD